MVDAATRPVHRHRLASTVALDTGPQTAEGAGPVVAPAEGAHLRPGVSADDARDMLAAYLSPDLYQSLVFRQGWSPERFGRWLSDALAAALLR